MFRFLKRKDKKCRYEISEVSTLMTKLHALKNISNNDTYIKNNFSEIENVNYDRYSDIINIKTRSGMVISITNKLIVDETNKSNKYQDILVVESLIDKTLIPVINTTKTKGVKFEIGEYLNDVFDDLKENTLRLEKELKEYNQSLRNSKNTI